MQLNEIHNPHEHASASLKVILLVFALILVGVLGYLVWDFKTAPDTADYSYTTVKKTETTETEEADETADWKTYTNTEYGFSYKHPDDWTTHEVTSTTSLGEPWKSYLFYSDYTPANASDHYGYVAISSKAAEILISLEFPGSTHTTEEATFAGKTATKATITTSGGSTATSYYISIGDKTYVVTGPIVSSSDDTNAKTNWEIVEKIINTFKLTN